ncbi:uncharacterized protein LOC125842817 [Solanum stenotomum]|uniref:uncharacterized protein LOC125842817 n=1 Tax=Solanum stenotomum TaxID=172797 RepID=UPI0020D0F72F|nr:uncharacterized protein LOC125842817 [Solanum stenotomum]
MGRKLEPQQSNNTITHFSHPHTLELITHQNFAPSQLCSGCKIQANGSVYTCKSCNFFLHVECSQMPQQINHPFDKEHSLTLLPKSIYPEGNFRCDACGETGDGFSYHCNSCGIDLHILCAVLPQYITHRSHRHQLEIQFSSPYPSKSFRCDICKNIGTKQWLYRCHTCGFDAHLNCTKLQSHFHQNPTRSSNSRSAPDQQYQHHCAGVDHMNQEIKNEISSLETLRKQREDEDKLMAEMIMGGVNHENQRLNELLGRTNPGINNGTTAAPQFGGSQNNEMSFPEILRKQREDQDKMMAEMISGANYRQNQQLSYLIAASSLNNQAINQQFNQTLMSYGGSAGAGQGQIPNLYQNTMGAGLFNTGADFAGLGLNALFGNLKF